MVVSKLNPVSFLHLQIPERPTKNYPSPQYPLFSFRNPSTLSLNIQLTIPSFQPKFPVKTSSIEEEKKSQYHHRHQNPCSLSVIFPSLAFSNTLFFNSPYNVQVFVGEDEPEEALINKFCHQVLKAGVLQECKWRRFFECTQEKRKRKTREAVKQYWK